MAKSPAASSASASCTLGLQGLATQAEQILRQSLDMLRLTLGEDAPEVGWVVRDLVPVFIARAELLVTPSRCSLPRYQWSTRQNEARFSQEVSQMLVDLYRAWDKPDKAAQWSAAASKPTAGG